jgi:hypothetical protein
MAINYAKIFNRRSTPQSQPIPGSNQVRNSGGGYSWQVDDWTRLDRFLILGAEGCKAHRRVRPAARSHPDAVAQRSQGLGSLARTHADDGDGPQPPQDDEHWPHQAVQRREDPNDRGMLDVVGFDTSVPAVIANFVRE